MTTLAEQIELMKQRRKARFNDAIQQASGQVQGIIMGYPEDVTIKDIRLEGSTIKVAYFDKDFVPFTIQFYGGGLVNAGGFTNSDWRLHTPESFWRDNDIIAGIARQLGE